jgi:chorismate--pyruvate lyase
MCSRQILPSEPKLTRWLRANGSLTARLRAHGAVTVQVVRQGNRRLWRQEQQDLQCASGHVREVILLLDGVPVVWARSATPHAALKGPWKALKNLGTRPLAELLFQEQRVHREPLKVHHIAPHGPIAQRVGVDWNPLAIADPDFLKPHWARSSVFWRHGQPLRVLEAFAPWVIQLAAGH